VCDTKLKKNAGIKTAHTRVRGREGVATLVKVKQEKPSDGDLSNQFPGHIGRHHEELASRYVFMFEERMMSSSEAELQMYAHFTLKAIWMM
jgi:hypothetical protein